KMLNEGIGATVYYNPPVHKTPYYHDTTVYSYKNNNKDLSNTEWSSEHVLSLPVHPLVTEQDIEKMASILKKTE
ncbi:MAG: DegT/DnrJ/EryC1/StrS family aminotransferase, partial [Nitrososphaeraceae archaeon]